MTTELEPVALAYWRKLIAEAIQAYFGDRGEDDRETVDDTTNHDVWEAFDALSAPEEAHPGEMTHRHKKRGSTYRILGEVRLQLSDPQRFTPDQLALDDLIFRLYQGADGAYSARHPEEFEDGRFELIAAPTPRPAAPTDGDVGALVERLNAAYEKVDMWPESRMQPDAVEQLGDGFIDLLKLRNLVPEAATALAVMSAKLAGVKRERDHFHDAYVRLTNELTEERSERSHQNRQAAEAVANAEAANADLRRQADAMREALEPFANEASEDGTGEYRWEAEEDNDIVCSIFADLTFGDFRRARAARASGGSDG